MIIMCTMMASKAQAQAALTKDRDRDEKCGQTRIIASAASIMTSHAFRCRH